ncbi:MAG TPA: glycosyltransferase [Opitutaceae bacterium]|jgi:glycosyltransferase involved in cell wall biosynthesis|nr:glycosyltransferase [Opitutaceae bacterium]
MKILIVQDHLRSGGTERQSILLTRAFAAAGHEATLLTFRPGGALAPTLDSVRHRALQPVDLHLDWFAPGLAHAVRTAAPDIVLCMGRMANCHAGGLQKKSPALAVIATMRTGKPLPRLFRRSLQQVRHIIANSHDAAAVLASQHDVAPAKITVIHNSLVFSPTGPPDHKTGLRAQLGATDATLVLLDVAMFRPEKNQRELIEIAAQLPAGLDWQLWLAGDGPERAACERLTAKKNLSQQVKFLGFRADPAPLYSAADLAVHTSLRESLPNFLIEAHAHGLASVAYDVGGVRETGAIAVPARDQAAFLARLQPLLTDPALRARTAAAAQTHAHSHFVPEQQAHAYLDLFARLLQAPAPA